MLATCAGLLLYSFFSISTFYFHCYDVLMFGPPDKWVVKQEICFRSQGLKSQLLIFFFGGSCEFIPTVGLAHSSQTGTLIFVFHEFFYSLVVVDT